MRWLVLVLGLLMAPLWAADGGKTGGKTDEATAWAALADVLENPAQRKALVAELRRLEAAGKAAGKEQAATTAAQAGDAAASADTAASGETTEGQEAAAAEAPAGEKKDEVQAEAAALQSVAENARAAVVSAAAWPKKVAEAGVQVAARGGFAFCRELGCAGRCVQWPRFDVAGGELAGAAADGVESGAAGGSNVVVFVGLAPRYARGEGAVAGLGVAGGAVVAAVAPSARCRHGCTLRCPLAALCLCVCQCAGGVCGRRDRGTLNAGGVFYARVCGGGGAAHRGTPGVLSTFSRPAPADVHG